MIVAKLHSKSSTGFDNIPITIIKKVIQPIADPLCHLINLSLLSGTVPKLLKIAKIIPIYKSGPVNDAANFRPISLLPSFSKIFEQAVCDRLVKHLNHYDIITSAQHGFRAGHNTTTALISGLSYIYDAIDNHDSCIGIFLDVAKAFDSINHDILLSKLHHYGIRGLALSWFRSYISDCYQFIPDNNNTSTYAPIRSGVPQGPYLDPSYFFYL